MNPELYDYKLSFEPNEAIAFEHDIGGESIPVAIEFDSDTIGSGTKWALFINDIIECSSDDYQDYLSCWDPIIPEYTDNVLIIGGGDMQLAKYIQRGSKEYESITVVDPLCKKLGNIMQFFTGPNDNSYTNLVPSTFGEFIVDSDFASEKYQTILVDISEDSMDATKQIYCQEFFKSLTSLLDENGKVLCYAADGAINHFERYFRVVGERSKWIESYQFLCKVIELEPHEKIKRIIRESQV